MAIRVGGRLYGLKTPAPIPSRCVATAQAAAAGRMPRANMFSANHTEAKPAASAAFAWATHCAAESPPCRRTLSFGDTGNPRSHAAGPRAAVGRGEMRVHHAPGAVFLAEHH